MRVEARVPFLVSENILLIRSILALLVVTVGVLWLLSRSPDYQLFGELVSSVETNEKLVALTFDDGPSRDNTPRILTVLEAYNVKATFYLVGEAISYHPDEARAIAAAGHEIGNHSYTHSRMLFKPVSFMAAEVEQTSALIRNLGYTGDIHFRPPYGKKLFVLPFYLWREGIKTISWSVAPESNLPAGAGSEAIAAYVLEHTEPGDIVLLHVMFRSREKSLAAVPLVIEGLRERGYQFVTVSELLAHGGV
ncbi:MAG: polysaccharide deacetylase family protein [Halioglobus sp.]|nr:polysaccharide deacetylase family protein [Halioglobus sp.]